MTRFEIEMKVDSIIEKVAEEHEVERDFYGDCLPIEIINLENAIERHNEDADDLFEQIEEILKSYAEIGE